MRPATCHMSQEMATVNNAISCSGSRIPSSKNKIPEFSFYKFLVNSGTCQSLVKSRFSFSSLLFSHNQFWNSCCDEDKGNVCITADIDCISFRRGQNLRNPSVSWVFFILQLWTRTIGLSSQCPIL